MSQYQLYITSSTLPSIHPNQDVFPFTIGSFPQSLRNKISSSVALGVGFNNTDNFTGETFNNVVSSSFISPFSPLSDKIRIIESQTEGNTLNPYLRIEKNSPFDYSVDTNDLFIGFSQTKQINKDIISQLGTNFSLDEYIGDSNYQYSSSYDELKGIRKHYFSKYQGRNNINNFVNLTSKYDHSVLNIVEKIIPGRTNSTIGTVIEPSILERPKISRLEPTISNVSYSSSIDSSPISTGDILVLEKTLKELKGSGSINITNDNIDDYTPSKYYFNADGSPANYEPNSSISRYSSYNKSSNLDFSTNPNITNPNAFSTLIYVFDSLVPFRTPTINLLSSTNDLKNYFVLSDGEPIIIYPSGISTFLSNDNSSLTPFQTTRTANSIKLKAGSGWPDNDVFYNVKNVLTSSYFDISPGQIITISGSYFQPEMGAFNLGTPGQVNTSKLLIDSCVTESGWSNPLSENVIITTGSSFPFPSGSSGTYLQIDLATTATSNPFPIYKYYSGFPTDGSKIRLYFYTVTNAVYGGGDITFSVLQNNILRGKKTLNISDIFYVPTETYIDFTSVSSSIEFKIEHGYNGGTQMTYKIDSISTSSFASGYNAPYARIRILSGSYNNFTSSDAGQSYPSGTYDENITEIISTGFLKADDFTSTTVPFNISQITDISSSYTNAFFEIEFYVSRSFGDTRAVRVYNDNPISLNDLILNAGGTKENYAFRIEKIINIDSDNIGFSEIITKDDSDFLSYLDNELIPSFNFSIASFDNFPNRLKPSYNILTSSFGPRTGLVERGNLTDRNYLPLELNFGFNENDDMPNFYNFDGGGIIIPTNTSDSFKRSKQGIIDFTKLVSNNNLQDF